VCLIDTERGSGDLYAHLYEYSVITLEPPFKPDILIEAIHAAEKAGFNVIIIDSLWRRRPSPSGSMTKVL